MRDKLFPRLAEQPLRTSQRGAARGSKLLLIALAGTLLACSKVRDIKRDGGSDEPSTASETDAGRDGGSADEAEQRMRTEMVAKLRECGALSRVGTHNGFLYPLECLHKCFLSANCEEAKADWCRWAAAGTVPQQREEGRGVQECQQKCYAPTSYCDATLRNVPRCDDTKDCPDGSDEVDCDYFVCADGQRAHPISRCDGEPQCDDGSDEDDCDPQYVCEDGEVLRGGIECDGVKHCLDESDERGCIERGVTVECAGGGWIRTASICDGRRDCGSGWDETQGCAQNLCDPR